MPITKEQWVATLRSGKYSQGQGKYKQPLTTGATERSNADRLGKLLDDIAGDILHARQEGKQDG